MPLVEKSVDVNLPAEAVYRCLLELRHPPALAFRSSDVDERPGDCRRSLGPSQGEICWRFAQPRTIVRAMPRRLAVDTTRLILQAECAGHVATVSELRSAIDGALAALKRQLERGPTGVGAGQ